MSQPKQWPLPRVLLLNFACGPRPSLGTFFLELDRFLYLHLRDNVVRGIMNNVLQLLVGAFLARCFDGPLWSTHDSINKVRLHFPLGFGCGMSLRNLVNVELCFSP